MQNNSDTKITIIVGTIFIAASLFIVTITMMPLHTYALSRYVIDDPNPVPGITNGKTDKILQQDDLGYTAKPAPTTLTLPTIPSVDCATNTIESLQYFLDCLGAK
jgi:hypothetical protein